MAWQAFTPHITHKHPQRVCPTISYCTIDDGHLKQREDANNGTTSNS
jgi:hypothetical protein